MNIYTNEEDGTVEITLELWDYAEEVLVYRLVVDGEEDVYFEVPREADALDVVDAAFAARRGVRNE